MAPLPNASGQHNASRQRLQPTPIPCHPSEGEMGEEMTKITDEGRTDEGRTAKPFPLAINNGINGRLRQ